MNNEIRWLAAGLVVSVGALLVAGRGDAGGDKGPWQPLLSKEIYQELAKREAGLLRELLGGKAGDKEIQRAKFGAVFIAALTMSVKGGKEDELRGTRETALLLARTLDKKGQIAAAKKLADQLPDKTKPIPGDKPAPVNWVIFLEMPDLMDPYRPKAKGGDGMHPDLQSNIRLKGALNGIEEKIRALAMKELTAANLKKEAKELELLGYHSAVVGSLVSYYGPTKKAGKRDPQEWRNLSMQMRDNSVSLAVAAKKGDAAAIFKASNSLNSTCSQCHTVFRN